MKPDLCDVMFHIDETILDEGRRLEVESHVGCLAGVEEAHMMYDPHFIKVVYHTSQISPKELMGCLAGEHLRVELVSL